MTSGALLWRVFIASVRYRPLASGLSLVAVALGIALGLAVQLVQGAAVDEFGRNLRALSGAADLQVVGPRNGFDERVYLALTRHPDVAAASPVVEVEAHLPGREERLTIHGVDLFRAAQVAPLLLPEYGAGRAASEGGRFTLLTPETVYLTPSAQQALALETGATLTVQSGLEHHELTVRGTVPAPFGQTFGVMDIAAVQQGFDHLGRLTRIDLRLAAGVNAAAARERLEAEMPAGVNLITPEAAVAQATGLSRAYRVNMAMLAAMALACGGLLVFSAQWLAVVRRRQEWAFLRALGVSRRAVFYGLLSEGAALGLAGALIGVGLAYVLAGAAFALVGADLGAGYFRGVSPELRFEPIISALYVVFGVAVGVVGAWVPARMALRWTPVRGLRGGDELAAYRLRATLLPAFAALSAAGVLCMLPPVRGLPLGGYLAVALVLVGAVLMMPVFVRLLGMLPTAGLPVVVRLAHARVVAAPGQAVVAGAGVIASVALAVAMAIMVSSFRVSVDDWLTRMLPADLQVRASSAQATGYLNPDEVARIAALPGVAEVRPVWFGSVRLDTSRPPPTLIVRDVDGGDVLPLVAEAAAHHALPSAWVSEAVADLYDLQAGARLMLPLGGLAREFTVAGVWRDYARQHGAVVIEPDVYRGFGGDERAHDVAVTLAPGASRDEVARAGAALFAPGRVEIVRPGELRARSLALFDRTFLVTYLMEAVAILIGLFGICTTFAALAVSRRKEFGVLRHLGLERRRVGRLLALEGGATAALGVCVGMAGGVLVAVILIEVINRQSFHWSMDMHVPYSPIGVFGVALVVGAALAARLAGAGAMRNAAARAVREDG